MVSECTLRLFMHLGSFVKLEACRDSEHAGLIWSSRKPMPSDGGHGVVSTYYRNCLRFADAPVHAPRVRNSLPVAPIQEALQFAVKLPVSNELPLSHAPADDETSFERDMRLTIPEACPAPEPEAVLHPLQLITQESLLSKRAATVVRQQPGRQARDRHMDQFLQRRGFISDRVLSQASAGFVGAVDEFSTTLGQSAASESIDAVHMFTPSTAILPMFFAGIFVLEIGGTIDIYDGVGSMFASTASGISLAIIIFLFLIGVFRYVLGLLFRACNRHPCPLNHDNALLLLSWTALIVTLTAQVRQHGRYHFLS